MTLESTRESVVATINWWEWFIQWNPGANTSLSTLTLSYKGSEFSRPTEPEIFSALPHNQH